MTLVESTYQPLVAVVEDDPDLCTLLLHHLRQSGFRAWVEGDGRHALTRVRAERPDLLLLDLMLPGISGTAVLAELRRDEALQNLPVIVFTAKNQEPEELVGFALGADDYIGKPFSMDLLVARIHAVLRRCGKIQEKPFSIAVGPFLLVAERNYATIQGEHLNLTRTEFQLLQTIVRAGGRVVHRNRLMEQIFETSNPTDRRIDVHMTNLRRKLGTCANWIQTIRGVGYACRDPQATESVAVGSNTDS